MQLAHALRLETSTSEEVVSLVGAGGKSTALFKLARQLTALRSPAVIVSATAHLGKWQIPHADRHIVATKTEELAAVFEGKWQGVTLVTGEIKDERSSPIDHRLLDWLRATAEPLHIPLLIEADGSRGHPLKAPALHEPPIPEFSDAVIVVAGLSGLGKPLDEFNVYRAGIFSQLSGLELNQNVTSDASVRVLVHTSGGLKNIPAGARRIALLNQAESPALLSAGGAMAGRLLEHFDSVLVGSLDRERFQTIERTAAVVLAAGESKRFGRPKQLLEWHGQPFVRHVAETAIQAGLAPVVVVTGFCAAEVEAALQGLPVAIAHNPDYQKGQSTSVVRGVQALPKNIGAALFLLADQPQIPAGVMRALVGAHARELPPIVAPLVLEERRANPVLFDKATFPDLLQLTGDVGGRAIFPKYKVEFIPWHDEMLLIDVDKPEDYQRLVEDETL